MYPDIFWHVRGVLITKDAHDRTMGIKITALSVLYLVRLGAEIFQVQTSVPFSYKYES